MVKHAPLLPRASAIQAQPKGEGKGDFATRGVCGGGRYCRRWYDCIGHSPLRAVACRTRPKSSCTFAAARLRLECIGNSDALYHNVEHSMLVTLAGHDILMGRTALRATTPGDYANFVVACLTHDIGYARGILQGYDNETYVADLSGRTVRLPRGSSDAVLAPYHVDRSKLYVFERLEGAEEGRNGIFPFLPGHRTGSPRPAIMISSTPA